jgi:hypothetical protein
VNVAAEIGKFQRERSMASPANNLFLRLHKWTWRQDENFLTESLAVVLEQLDDCLEKARSIETANQPLS